jgi:hypothetical protein
VPDDKNDPKPTETEVNEKPDEEKNIDRDGGHRQPSEWTNDKK